jgi:hypothetical protein
MFGLLGVVIGIVLILLGGFLVFFFPSTTIHQGEDFGVAGVVLGFIILLIGGVLVFFG